LFFLLFLFKGISLFDKNNYNARNNTVLTYTIKHLPENLFGSIANATAISSKCMTIPSTDNVIYIIDGMTILPIKYSLIFPLLLPTFLIL